MPRDNLHCQVATRERDFTGCSHWILNFLNQESTRSSPVIQSVTVSCSNRKTMNRFIPFCRLNREPVPSGAQQLCWFLLYWSLNSCLPSCSCLFLGKDYSLTLHRVGEENVGLPAWVKTTPVQDFHLEASCWEIGHWRAGILQL